MLTKIILIPIPIAILVRNSAKRKFLSRVVYYEPSVAMITDWYTVSGGVTTSLDEMAGWRLICS